MISQSSFAHFAPDGSLTMWIRVGIVVCVLASAVQLFWRRDRWPRRKRLQRRVRRRAPRRARRRRARSSPARPGGLRTRRSPSGTAVPAPGAGRGPGRERQPADTGAGARAMQEKPQVEDRMNDAQRAQLIGALRSLFGASLQKIFLLSPQVVALQLRLPGRTLFASLDARTGLAALLAERPAAAAGREGAPKAQATLRAALGGAILRGARLERPAAASEESRRLPSLRLSFETPQGPRA